jgi:serine/threonine protein kinase
MSDLASSESYGSMASALPSSLGRYEVLEELGKGAMGVVYLARDPLIGRMVALKTFRASQAMHGAELVEYRTRFMREAQSAGILSHPHIVTIHDVVDGTDGGGVTFIAMEYVRGINLKELLLRGDALSLDRVCDIVSQLAEALDYAHSKGVIHRDIKPANIIIDATGRVKITDFGIARLETSDLTHEGQLLGTPNYMAPERILGHKVDHRTDIFSMGVVLYEMLTRQKPFQGENLTMVSHRIVYEPFTPPRQYAPGLPPAVAAVLDQALEKQPERRFNSAGELAAKLREAVTTATANETTVAARPPMLPPPPPAAVPPPPVVPPPPPGATSTANDDHNTQDVAAIAAEVRGPVAVPAPAAARSSFPPVARMAAVGIGSLVLGLLLAVGGFAWLRKHDTVLGSIDPAERAQAQYRQDLQEARVQLDAGHPDLALAAIGRALAVAPNDPDLQRMSARIRTQLDAQQKTAAEQHAQLGALLQAAQSALAAGNPTQAAELASQVLVLAPGDAAATAVIAQAQTAIDAAKRHGPAATQTVSAARTPVPAAAPVQPVADPQLASAPVTLRIDFFTELPEGVLTVYAGGTQILGEPFRFYKREKLFRNIPEAGRIEASREVSAGATTLRIYVALPKRAPVVKTLQVQLVGGSTRLLRIHFDKAGQMAAAVE